MQKPCTRGAVQIARVALLCAAMPVLHAAIAISLSSSVSPPAPVGTVVTWMAGSIDDGPGPVWYRFRVRQAGGVFQVVRDYSPASRLDWTASEQEGSYQIEVTARDNASGEIAAAVAPFDITSRVSAGSPVISGTSNALVFLYSAPPCPVGSSMRVRFQDPQGVAQQTPMRQCASGFSMNFYLAGMRPGTTYSVQHIVSSGTSEQPGPVLSLTTPAVSLRLPGVTVATPAKVPGLVLHSTIFGPPFATDLAGNLVWYYAGKLTFLTRPQSGGYFYSLIVDPRPDTSLQILREFDLAGNTVRETNAARINEQLTARGMHTIGAFHHEAVAVPGGRVLVLASTERMLAGVQGPGPVDVLGDMILVLDRDLQVIWAWDAFDHLDPGRAATMSETCGPTTSGCPPIYLAQQANDWLHGNALQFTASGDILYSSRHQDWVIKIDYGDGGGTGNIIWRLGKDGDFQMVSGDPNPWFSHQHDPEFAPGSDSILTVFDDGNLRVAADSAAHSRGQVLQIDEKNMTATLAVNADLGAFSFAMGSAQQTPGGNFYFGGGWLPDNTSRMLEFDGSGNKIYDGRVQAPEYRSFRMADLYTYPSGPPTPGTPSVTPRCPIAMRFRPAGCRENLAIDSPGAFSRALYR